MQHNIWVFFLQATWFFTLALFCFALFVHYRKARSIAVVLRETLEACDVGRIYFNSNGKLLMVNKKAQTFVPAFGVPGGDKITLRTFWNMLFDQGLDCDQGLLNTVVKSLSTKKEYDFVEVIDWGVGGICLVEAKKLSNGITYFLLSDISSDRIREDHVLMLNETNHQLTEAVEAATNGIVVTDPKRSGNPIIFVNNALCQFVGQSRENLFGAGWSVFSPMFVDAKEEESCFTSLAYGNEGEFELVVKKGPDIRWFSLRLTPVRDKKGVLDYFIGVMTETTLLKRREAEAFQGKKLEALGQLAAGVAHDFNNILSIIDGFGLMAEGSLEENSKPALYVQRMRSATRRGAALTKKMLMFSKHKIVSKQVIDLSEVVDEYSALLLPLVNASIHFDIKINVKDLRVKASADAISQILMNLVLNARDAMPNGGTLLVEVSSCEEKELPKGLKNKLVGSQYACFSVLDTGTGMDESVVERIFDPFFTTKTQGKGTGLGMSIVYGLIQEMGGGIDVISSLGKGTNVSIYLPRCYEPVSRKIVGNPDDASSLRLEGFTILVVEDEADLLHVISSVLEKAGMRVLSAKDGNEALVLQDELEGPLDILLSDISLPELNGVRLAELLSSLRTETKILFMSGYPASGELAPVTLPEGAMFIAKPFTYDNLLIQIYKALNDEVSSSAETGLDGGVAHWESTNTLH